MISAAPDLGAERKVTGSMAATLVVVAGAAAAAGLGAGVLGWPLLAVLAILALATPVFYRPSGTAPCPFALRGCGLMAQDRRKLLQRTGLHTCLRRGRPDGGQLL